MVIGMIKKFIRWLVLALISNLTLAQNYVWIIGAAVGLAGGDTWQILLADFTSLTDHSCKWQQGKSPGKCGLTNNFETFNYYIKWGCINKDTYFDSIHNDTIPTINKEKYTLLKPEKSDVLTCD